MDSFDGHMETINYRYSYRVSILNSTADIGDIAALHRNTITGFKPSCLLAGRLVVHGAAVSAKTLVIWREVGRQGVTRM